MRVWGMARVSYPKHSESLGLGRSVGNLYRPGRMAQDTRSNDFKGLGRWHGVGNTSFRPMVGLGRFRCLPLIRL